MDILSKREQSPSVLLDDLAKAYQPVPNDPDLEECAVLLKSIQTGLTSIALNGYTGNSRITKEKNEAKRGPKTSQTPTEAHC